MQLPLNPRSKPTGVRRQLLAVSLECVQLHNLRLQSVKRRLGIGQFGFLFVDHLGGGFGDELFVLQLALGPLDVALEPGDFFAQPGNFRFGIDQTGHRHQHFHLADHTHARDRGLCAV